MFLASITFALLLLQGVCFAKTTSTAEPQKSSDVTNDDSTVCAVAVLQGPSNVKGTVTFLQPSQTDTVAVHYNISGNDPNALRGFHVHELGDLQDGCSSAGSHYNPLNRQHGGPNSENRHMGDLGNVKTDEDGNAIGIINDSQLTLFGVHSIVGRSIVIHSGEDDLGQFDGESKITGNSGSRNACGTISIANNSSLNW